MKTMRKEKDYIQDTTTNVGFAPTIVEEENKAPEVTASIFSESIDPLDQYELTTKRKVHLVHKLGEGRFGVVYLGLVKNFYGLLSKKVLKFLRYVGANQFDAFSVEAQIMMELEHEALLGINEIALIKDVPIIVMDYFPSRNLKEIVKLFKRDDHETEGGIPPNFACLIIGTVADGLAIMHERGFVHRDIKSGNILVGFDGRTKLSDFGVSYQPGQRITVAGTLNYMAPEQVVRLINKNLDPIVPTPALDIWSLGVVFFELLTGHEAFGGARDIEDLYEMQKAGPMIDMNIIPSHIAEMLSRMLVFDPEKRMLSAEDVSRQVFLINKSESNFEFTEKPIKKLFKIKLEELITRKSYEVQTASEMARELKIDSDRA